MGCAVLTLLVYYTPRAFGANYGLNVVAGALYGATLAAYVPFSALVPCLAPKKKGAAMSVLNLGAGASAWVGPGIVALLLPVVGVVGVMWTYAVLYLISAALALVLTLPSAEPKRSEATLA